LAHVNVESEPYIRPPCTVSTKTSDMPKAKKANRGWERDVVNLLRHNPNIRLNDEGYASAKDVMRVLGIASHGELARAVRDSNNRLQLSGDSVRATSGHSISGVSEVGPPLDPSDLPTCFHATPRKNLDAILREGISRMGRQHVHLSRTLEGVPGGRDAVLHVDSASAIRSGIQFRASSDSRGTVLCPGDVIPAEFIVRVTDRSGNDILPSEAE
jgi:putative RNA 2'-phosphotransferase